MFVCENQQDENPKNMYSNRETIVQVAVYDSASMRQVRNQIMLYK